MTGRAEFDPETINGTNIYDYTLERDWFDMGHDSQVYHPDEGYWMFHRYDRGVTLGQIQSLKEVTDRLAIYAPKYSSHIARWGLISLQVEKIVKVFQSGNEIFSIKKYVTGHRSKEGENIELDKVLRKYSEEMRSQIGFNWIDVVSSNTKANPVISWNFFNKRSIITVTDICAYVKSIGR